MTLASIALIALGILANVVTFTVGVMVGLVKRKESHDRDNRKDSAWWHRPQVQRL
jgi:amino acid transporter